MKFFVTGVGGQLGHDVMNELLKRGHEGVGSDIQPVYSGVEDGSAVTSAPYVALDATNEGGYISWYDFTKEIYRQAGYTTEVLPVTTAEYGLSKAVRPFNSRLDKSKLVEAGFVPLPTWQDAVSRYLKEIEQ